MAPESWRHAADGIECPCPNNAVDDDGEPAPAPRTSPALRSNARWPWRSSPASWPSRFGRWGRSSRPNTTDPLSVRVVEWARDHRLGGLVEHDRAGVVRASPTTDRRHAEGWHSRAYRSCTAHATTRYGARQPSARARLAAREHPHRWSRNPLPGEGVWQPSGRLVKGSAALWITYLRPDAVHTSLIAGVAHLDMARLSGHASRRHRRPRWRTVGERRTDRDRRLPVRRRRVQQRVPSRQQPRRLLRRGPYRATTRRRPRVVRDLRRRARRRRCSGTATTAWAPA